MKPCNECPFRIDALPGWLGGFTPEETKACAISESDFDCHPTRENDNPTPCIGRLLFAKNTAKSFRRSDLENLRNQAAIDNPDYKEQILSWNFTEYHKQFEYDRFNRR